MAAAAKKTDGDGGETGFESLSGDDFMEKIKIVVCKNIPDFAEKQERLGCPIKCLVYDTTIPVEGSTSLIPGSITLEPHDLPSFVYKPDVYLAILPLVLSRFSNIDGADWLLFNTYEKLEEEVMDWMVKQSQTRMITIGPTVPDTCTKWLDTKEVVSVVYISFGSLADLGEEQMEEIAWEFGIQTTISYG